MLLTAGSWFVLGIWKGWGYCLCTDWHWQVREQMGIHDRSNSYIHFLVIKMTGINIDEQLVEKITLFVFIICFILSLILNYRDYHRRAIRRS